MDDESGESMELMEEVPLKELREAELERLVRGWRRKAGSWIQRRGEAYWKDDVMDERVWPKMKSECCEEAELWWGYADMKVGWLGRKERAECHLRWDDGLGNEEMRVSYTDTSGVHDEE